MLKDTSALSSTIPEADLCGIRLLAPHTILNEGPLPDFQFKVANGQLEAPNATTDLQLDFGEKSFRGKFIVMKKHTSPLVGLLFLQRNNTILRMRQGVLNFSFFSMQLKTEGRTNPNIIEAIIITVETILQKGQRTTFWIKSQIHTNNEATGKFQPSPLLEKDEDLLICPALSTTQINKSKFQINFLLNHPCTFKKGMHIAIFSCLTREQTKHIKSVNITSERTNLNINHDDAIRYKNSFLNTSKTVEVTQTYWFQCHKTQAVRENIRLFRQVFSTNHESWKIYKN